MFRYKSGIKIMKIDLKEFHIITFRLYLIENLIEYQTGLI